MKRISPFALASVATLLAIRDQSNQPAQSYFDHARELLDAAAGYLAQPEQSPEAFMTRLGVKEYTFLQVLEKIPGTAAGKKGTTMLGGITTRAGLIKAIHRVFPETGDQIVQRGSLYNSEISEIRANSEKLNKVRTEAATQAKAATRPKKAVK